MDRLRAFSTQDALGINEIKTMKKRGLCFKCIGPNFQHDCSKNSNKNFKIKCLHNKLTKAATTWINFEKKPKLTTIYFKWEPFHSRYPNQLDQLKICWYVMTSLMPYGENRREEQLQEEAQNAT